MLYLLLALVMGAAAAFINKEKNRGNEVLAFFAGFFFGIIGILVNGFLPAIKEEDKKDN